ncbi:hypothetical protein JXQ31_06355 [candidate division KSB1 bacterium]|nr:hypothetical protein [candidate division KSB1 bacterium]
MAESTKGTEFRIVFVFIILAAAYFGYQKYFKPAGINSHNSQIIYDTDPKNDKFIKGQLTSQQLLQLDKILELEESQGGMRLSVKDLKRTAKDDRALYEAYTRWRKCKDMMRSKHRTIYPGDRKNLLK